MNIVLLRSEFGPLREFESTKFEGFLLINSRSDFRAVDLVNLSRIHGSMKIAIINKPSPSLGNQLEYFQGLFKLHEHSGVDFLQLTYKKLSRDDGSLRNSIVMRFKFGILWASLILQKLQELIKMRSFKRMSQFLGVRKHRYLYGFRVICSGYVTRSASVVVLSRTYLEALASLDPSGNISLDDLAHAISRDSAMTHGIIFPKFRH